MKIALKIVVGLIALMLLVLASGLVLDPAGSAEQFGLTPAVFYAARPLRNTYRMTRLSHIAEL